MDLLAQRRMMMTPATPPPTPVQIVRNGDFSNGTTGWTRVNSSVSMANDNGTLLVTVTTASSSASRGVYNSAKPVNGHTYYVKFKLVTSYNASVRVRTSSQAVLTISTTADTDKTSDAVKKYTGTDDQNLFCYSHYGVASTVGQTMRIYSAMAIDLTATFGEGNEPDLATCRRYYPNDYYDYYTG